MNRNALVAQLDRVTDYESVGQGFESLRARQKPSGEILEAFIFVSCMQALNGV